MVHEDYKHGGTHCIFLGIVRPRVWPIKRKKELQYIDTRHAAEPELFHQIMGSVPSTLVREAWTFINTGIDYCGPITVRYKFQRKRPHKTCIAVFVALLQKQYIWNL